MRAKPCHICTSTCSQDALWIGRLDKMAANLAIRGFCKPVLEMSGSEDSPPAGMEDARSRKFVPMPVLLLNHLPAMAAVAVFAERMREVFAKRQVVPGKT